MYFEIFKFSDFHHCCPELAAWLGLGVYLANDIGNGHKAWFSLVLRIVRIVDFSGPRRSVIFMTSVNIVDARSQHDPRQSPI